MTLFAIKSVNIYNKFGVIGIQPLRFFALYYKNFRQEGEIQPPGPVGTIIIT